MRLSNLFNRNIIKAHKHCMHNREMLAKDDRCGCFYCLKIFNPNEITDWVDPKDDTALCPFCGIDSVISAGSGYPVTKKFLEKMHKHWFGFKDV